MATSTPIPSEAAAHLAALVSMVVILVGVVVDGARQGRARRAGQAPARRVARCRSVISSTRSRRSSWPSISSRSRSRAYFAWRSFGAGQTTLGAAFSLFALAEISYMTYHLDWTVFLFAHTMASLDLLAFVLVFVAATQRALVGNAAPAR